MPDYKIITPEQMNEIVLPLVVAALNNVGERLCHDLAIDRAEVHCVVAAAASFVLSYNTDAEILPELSAIIYNYFELGAATREAKDAREKATKH